MVEGISSTCYYQLLGVSANASPEEIKKAYKRKAILCHPDKNLDNPVKAENEFRAISEAYQILLDKEKREIYDREGREGIMRRLQCSGARTRQSSTESAPKTQAQKVHMVFMDPYTHRGREVLFLRLAPHQSRPIRVASVGGGPMVTITHMRGPTSCRPYPPSSRHLGPTRFVSAPYRVPYVNRGHHSNSTSPQPCPTFQLLPNTTAAANLIPIRTFPHPPPVTTVPRPLFPPQGITAAAPCHGFGGGGGGPSGFVPTTLFVRPQMVLAPSVPTGRIAVAQPSLFGMRSHF